MDRGKMNGKAFGMQTSKANRADSTGHEIAREVALTALPCGVAGGTFMIRMRVRVNESSREAMRQGLPASATVGNRERLMTLGIVADPVTTVQAFTVRIAKLAPLALFRRCPPSASIRPVIALRVVTRSTCPGTL